MPTRLVTVAPDLANANFLGALFGCERSQTKTTQASDEDRESGEYAGEPADEVNHAELLIEYPVGKSIGKGWLGLIFHHVFHLRNRSFGVISFPYGYRAAPVWLGIRGSMVLQAGKENP